MKINTDLMDATMMISFIVLVLVGATTYQNPVTKDIVMASLALLCALTIVLRIIASRHHDTHLPTDFSH